ncbi:MAG: hypothetical protein JXA25_20550 [Anaerolineales bacterium]|nr:hypothetical protein [Anaerolineales bacterium]
MAKQESGYLGMDIGKDWLNLAECDKDTARASCCLSKPREMTGAIVATCF